MKKKISKLQLKKTVITVLGNQEKRNQQMADAMAISFPVYSCRPGCNPTFKCPPPPDVAE